jgi:hypothetical protein
MTATPQPGDVDFTGPVPLTWVVRPLRDDPMRAIAAFLSSMAIVLLAARFAPSPLSAVTLAVLILVSLAPAFLPIECRVEAGGVRRRVGWGWERRQWTDIRRARLNQRGLYVSTLLNGGALEPFRGLFLPLPRAAAPELMKELSERLRAHGV